MRIRKHAKISPLMYGNSSFYPPETLICQLNQSPWDVISFSTANSSSSSPDSCPLQTYQVDVDRLFPRDASFGDSLVGASHSVARFRNREWHYKEGNCMEMEASFVGKPETVGFNDAREGEVWRVPFPEEDEEEEEEEVVLCSKTDGKGWQCGKMVSKGQTMCDHHLKQLQNYVASVGKKAAKSSQVRPKRQTRVKKLAAAAAAANPHEFYYYSGFGPLWGKRRVPGHVTTPPPPPPSGGDNAVALTSNVLANAIESLGGRGTGSGLFPKPRVTSSSSETNGSEKEGFEYFDNHTVDDDDEDEEGGRPVVRGYIGTKRKRKPIKARSLKSLM